MGHSVFFVVRRGGHFNGQTTITTLTNSSGIAEATPCAGRSAWFLQQYF
jgi:hypothetical protein